MKRKTPKVGWCPQCGPLTAGALDEDGCCALCGADATGPGADKALRLLKRADPAKERALRAAAIRALAQTPPSGRYVPDEVLEKVNQLVFECDGVLDTKAPSRETYNAALEALEGYR